MKSARPPVLLVLVVLALHLLAGREVLRLRDGWVDEGPDIAHMQVEFVQELQPAEPRRPGKVEAETAPAPGRSSPPPARMPVPAEPASAPPAPAPEPEPEVATAAPAEPVTAPAPPAAETAASAPVDDDAGPEWPLSTRLSYVLTGNYRGPVSGQAQVDWLRKGKVYQVHLEVSIGPSFAPLATRRLSSAGELTPQGIAPQRYVEETRRILGEPRRFSQAMLSGLKLGQTYYTQDSISQFIQLTWLLLTQREVPEPGRVIELPLSLPSGPYDWRYEVVGEETVNTRLGPLPAWHLRPLQGARNGDLAAEVWFAPSLQYLPVRLLIRQDADTYIELTLDAAPLQAAPESPNDIPRRLSQ